MSKFYVYAFISKTDNTTVRYIGKGTGPRMLADQHRKYKVPHKNRKKVATGLTEQEAFTLERFLIALYGRLDLKTGTLTNLTDGGEGHSGYVMPQEERDACSARVTGELHPNYGNLKDPKERKKPIEYGKHPHYHGPPRTKNFSYANASPVLGPYDPAYKVNYSRDKRYHGPPRNPKATETHSQLGRSGALSGKSKRYIVTHTNGQEELVTGLSEWCRINGIGRGSMKNVLSGKIKQHKGMTIRHA